MHVAQEDRQVVSGVPLEPRGRLQARSRQAAPLRPPFPRTSQTRGIRTLRTDSPPRAEARRMQDNSNGTTASRFSV